MPKPRRNQSQTVTTALSSNTAKLASIRFPAGVPLPSDPIRRDSVLAMFSAVLSSRSVEDWDSVSLLVAARMASLLLIQIENEAALLEQGLLIDGISPMGLERKEQNPLIKALVGTNGLLVGVMRNLGLNRVDVRHIQAAAGYVGGAVVSVQGESSDGIDWSKE
jgi:hypothetical protein